MTTLRAKAANRVHNAILHLEYNHNDPASVDALDILENAERFVRCGFGAPKSWAEFLGI